MSPRHGTQVSLIAIAALTYAPAHAADIYKWIDENGSVNYAAKPPAGREAKQLEAGSRLTIYQSNIHEVERRWREADAKRIAAAPVPVPVPAAPYAAPFVLPGVSEQAYRELWLKRCRDDRRVDCDDPLAFLGYAPGAPYYGPVHVLRAPPRRALPIGPVAQESAPQQASLHPGAPLPGGPALRWR